MMNATWKYMVGALLLCLLSFMAKPGDLQGETPKVGGSPSIVIVESQGYSAPAAPPANNQPPQEVPEPSALALLLSGLLGAAILSATACRRAK